MATPTKTANTTTTTKPKKDPVPVAKRIEDQLKRAAVTGKINKDQLAQIETLAKSLAVFVS